MLRSLQAEVTRLRVDFSERMATAEATLEHIENTLTTFATKESVKPVRWILFLVVGAVVLAVVGAVLSKIGISPR